MICTKKGVILYFEVGRDGGRSKLLEKAQVVEVAFVGDTLPDDGILVGAGTETIDTEEGEGGVDDAAHKGEAEFAIG